MKFKNCLNEAQSDRKKVENFQYFWSVDDSIKIDIADVHAKIKEIMTNGFNPGMFYIDALEECLSTYFDTKVTLYSCKYTKKSFGFAFTGKKIHLQFEILY